MLEKASNADIIQRLANYDVNAVGDVFKMAINGGVNESSLVVNPALARGLDYYTGLIFEVVLKDDRGLGTICAGGRYANLCSMFSREEFSGIGLAFGFERLVEALETRGQLENIKLQTQVLVVNFGEELATASLELAQKLRSANIATELYFDEAKLAKQFKYADKKGIPWVIICGEEETKKGVLLLKNMVTGEQNELLMERAIERILSV